MLPGSLAPGCTSESGGWRQVSNAASLAPFYAPEEEILAWDQQALQGFLCI